MNRMSAFIALISLALISCGSKDSAPIAQTMPAPAVINLDSLPESYTARSVTAVPTAFGPLMGQWVSAFDDQETLHFLPGRYITYYDGQKVVEEAMSYFDQCPEACGLSEGQTGPCFTLEGEFGASCFAIVRLSEEEMELAIPGGGPTLIYRRLVEQ